MSNWYCIGVSSTYVFADSLLISRKSRCEIQSPIDSDMLTGLECHWVGSDVLILLQLSWPRPNAPPSFSSMATQRNPFCKQSHDAITDGNAVEVHVQFTTGWLLTLNVFEWATFVLLIVSHSLPAMHYNWKKVWFLWMQIWFEL